MANEQTTTGFEDEEAVVGIQIGGLPHSELMQASIMLGYNSPATSLLLGRPA
jgi:hypothetical protein